jgi:hypothetical protein
VKVDGLYCFIIILLCCLSFITPAQSQILQFPHAQHVALRPTEFYIENIIDSRKDKSTVAFLLLPENSDKALPFNFKSDLRSSLMQYVRTIVPQKSALRPVVIRVKSFVIREASQGSRTVLGNFEISFSFELKGEDENTRLVDYKGKAQYTRPVNDRAVVESTLSDAVLKSLSYFNRWINSHAKTNEILARGVRFNFKDHMKNEEVDTLFYDSKRPLSWADFKGKSLSHDGKYAASVFSFFAVESKNELTDGIVQVNMNLKVYLVRNFSWVRDYARDAYTLNHEQRHFDIAKIISERFREKLLNDKMTVANFEGIISFEYIESLRELDRMQKLYDGETRHGIDSDMQKVWNERIEKELRSFEVKGST